MSMNGEYGSGISYRNMEAESFPFPHFKKPKLSSSATATTTTRNDGDGDGDRNLNLKMKTQLCRRFRQGVCVLGSKCNYAHGLGELRRTTNNTTSFHKPKICRMFFQYKHCSYGPTCRFLHSSPPNPQVGKLGGYFSAEHKITHTSTAAPIGPVPIEYNTATNASTTSTVEPTSLHKNGPYAFKCMFKTTEIQKISRIYADWI